MSLVEAAPEKDEEDVASLRKNGRRKVPLGPGCGPLDWIRLSTAPGANLSGTNGQVLRITPSELAKHNTEDDLWMALGGRVYNCTEYIRFHPGGKAELMRVAGKDGTKLFYFKHQWVNFEALLKGCLVGILVSEDF